MPFIRCAKEWNCFVRIYINGKDFTKGSSATGGNGTSGNQLAGNFTIANISADLLFGKGPSDTGVAAMFSTLKIHEIFHC